MHRQYGLITEEDVFKFIREKEDGYIEPSIFTYTVKWRLFGYSEKKVGLWTKNKANFVCKELNEVGFAAIIEKVK